MLCKGANLARGVDFGKRVVDESYLAGKFRDIVLFKMLPYQHADKKADRD